MGTYTSFNSVSPIRQELAEIKKRLKYYYVGGEIPYIDEPPKRSDFGLPEEDKVLYNLIEEEKYPNRNTLMAKLFGPGKPKESPTENKLRNFNIVKQTYEFWNKLHEIDFWDSLNGHEFEIVVAAIYHHNGFSTKISECGPDGGIDIVMTKGNTKYAVQCKAHSKAISQSVVRDLYGTMLQGGFDQGIIVSKNGFSSKCYQFARNIPIKLVTLRDLARMTPSADRDFYITAKKVVEAKHFEERRQRYNEREEKRNKEKREMSEEIIKKELELQKQIKELEKQKAIFERQKNEFEIEREKEKSHTVFTENESKKNNVVKNNCKPVFQLNDSGIVINRFPSVTAAVNATGINSKSIRDAIKGVQKHAGGYVWKYDS